MSVAVHLHHWRDGVGTAGRSACATQRDACSSRAGARCRCSSRRCPGSSGGCHRHGNGGGRRRAHWGIHNTWAVAVLRPRTPRGKRHTKGVLCVWLRRTRAPNVSKPDLPQLSRPVRHFRKPRLPTSVRFTFCVYSAPDSERHRGSALRDVPPNRPP